MWQFRLPEGFTIACPHSNDREQILMVYAGQVRVRIRGVAEFVAKPWDYIDLPAWLDAELTVLSDEAVVYDMNCQGYLYSALEEIAMRAPGEPGLLADEAALRAILRKNDVRLFGYRGISFSKESEGY